MCPPTIDPMGLDVSDEQVISFLDGFKIGALLPMNVFDDINPFQFQPSNLPDGIWYIMHSNMNKENDFGFWKVKEEEGLEVFKNSSITGWRRTLEFFEFVDYPEKKTDWLMQEYSITQKGECGADKDKEKELRAMCRIFPLKKPDCKEDQHPKSIAPTMDSNSREVSTSGSLMKNSTTVNGTSEDIKLLDPQQKLFFDGDYLELDDLAEPLSHSSSSDNSCRSSMSFDELEDNRNNQIHQGKDSSAKCRVNASIRPLEMVMQPAPSRPLVYDTVKHQPSGCKQTSSLIETKFFNERLGNHSIEKLKVEQRDEDDPLTSSHGAVASSSIAAMPAPEEKEEDEAAAAAVLLPNPRGLKKYFCFLPF